MLEELFDLRDRVVVITGGSRGLGIAMAHGFAERGAKLVIASRKVENCEAAAKEISDAYGTEAIGVGCHVGEWDDCDRLIETSIEHFGRIHVFINNAGMSPLYSSLPEVTEALWDKVLNVNLRGPFRLATLAGAHMAEAGGGSIINVSSIASVQPGAAEIPYGAAKAGLNNLTLGLARCFGETVRVNCIMPGPFLTDISKAWDMDGFNAMAATRIPLKRGGEPNEVVGAALYLASDASSYTTGSVIKIDGGTVWAPG